MMVTQSISPLSSIEIKEESESIFLGHERHDPDVPSYDSDGDGVSDANDSHPYKLA